MKRSKAQTRVTVLPPLTATDTDVSRLSHVHALPFWADLTNSEQAMLADQTRHLMVAYLQLDLTPIEIGQRLVVIKQLLSSHKGAFAVFLKRTKGFAGRSAYRYIEDYERLKSYFSEPVLEEIIRHGFKFKNATRKRPLGVWTEAYIALKMNSEEPPKTDDPLRTARYLQKLELTHEALQADQRSLAVVRARAMSDSPGNPEFEAMKNSFEFISKQTFQTIKNGLRRLKPEERTPFLELVNGAILSHRGMTRATYTAVAIPQEWNRRPGRPSSEERMIEVSSPRERQPVEF